MLFHLLGHTDHNVVTGTLEALQQLLRHPSAVLIDLLNSRGSLEKSLIYAKDQTDSNCSQGKMCNEP